MFQLLSWSLVVGLAVFHITLSCVHAHNPLQPSHEVFSETLMMLRRHLDEDAIDDQAIVVNDRPMGIGEFRP